jgi:hypothetical protein
MTCISLLRLLVSFGPGGQLNTNWSDKPWNLWVHATNPLSTQNDASCAITDRDGININRVSQNNDAASHKKSEFSKDLCVGVRGLEGRGSIRITAFSVICLQSYLLWKAAKKCSRKYMWLFLQKEDRRNVIEPLLSEHFFWLRNVIRNMSLLGLIYVFLKYH